ncbi:MAG: hypothetical protein ISR91_00650 [Candidatus Delongbacteria bacterium]|nr:hypothetical protein [Candidatus Delongbacteria bacterium]
METKSYTGTNYRDIMNRIKRDFGEEAIIVKSGRQNHPAGSEFGWSYEVVVGQSAESTVISPGVFGSTPVQAASDQRETATLQVDMKRLTQSIQDLQQQMGTPGLKPPWPVLADLAQKLLLGEVNHDVIQKLLQDLQMSATPRELRSRSLIQERASRWIARRFKAAGTPSAPAGTALKLAFIGPTGAGKTVSLIKLAANRAFFGGRRLGILSLDTKKLAAAQQLQLFADIVKADLKLVYRDREIKPALRDLEQCDVILIDTPGISWRAGRQMREMEKMLELAAPAETHLVLPLNTKYSDLSQMVREYRQISYNRILLTKLDETGTLGNVLNLASDIKPVFSFLGSGQRIPEDLLSMRPAQIAAWLLEGKGFAVKDQ